MKASSTIGCLLGTAVGDALGLPYEALSPQRAAKLLGPSDRYRLIGRWGLVSDDTEHSCLVAETLIESGGSPDAFRRGLARRLRQWLLTLPAGVGSATARAILKLWVGFSPERSGVFSAGNGPAMRAPILGVGVADPSQLRAFVRASTRLTHTDPQAEHGAYAIALAARMAAEHAQVHPDAFLGAVSAELGAEAKPLTDVIAAAARSAARGESTPAFAASIGLAKGVSGYVNHSVPVALHAWFRHPDDLEAAVWSVIECGGDTDTTAAMVGGILGAALGPSGIPPRWLQRLAEWPRSVAWMERLGDQLADTLHKSRPQRAIRVPIFAVLLRNLLFLLIVLVHGFRRLLPPY
ncbi:ADP-ribosylglycohydrolase family protein [Thiorhodococcus mannitoliphagus]|uniref:ADP-ribosylglycohydrolase family protein n=1 Tax=Thiorhodococcus mannitoliphagus TaxID=329406 RepID=A0A6P1DYJ9_9GAMM|nr:ADP-ribosylglycohydrolase family protein [Thiorhodococcus mannitoliphagus]NEX22163.1 ADP-ribosylglycohydrolase family protein [Thiorhodococcus mannitoliphagus]